jgi:hypothetical protein
MKPWLLFVLLGAVSLPALGHELQSVVLRLDELPSGLVQATLKTPLSREGEPAALVAHFRGVCKPLGEARVERQPEIVLRQWRVRCEGGLSEQVLYIDGLNPRMPDAIVTTAFAGGRQQTAVVDRHDPVLRLHGPSQAGSTPELLAYLPIGIEHILFGPDHLLFVLGLMLVVWAAGRRTRTLVYALTAFTLAHSLTLALATLGIWGLPSRPVELLIALSIALLAWELATAPARKARGLAPSLTLRKPWLVAFVFGLLHGFGFAGALAELGLPEQARGWALLLFNLGVEIGQLLFVCVILGVLAIATRLRRRSWPASYASVVVTVLGGMATYWTLDRGMAWLEALRLGV